MPLTAEETRLREAREKSAPWKKWGPYLSERQWGTVREDYSDSGNAWDYFSHDQSRSRAYRWGEDGLAGVSDDRQRLCFALALWNGADAILKERLFGVTNSEGNHGEDVKEYYFYLDSTPTHSYMKYLYKYPQGVFPYEELIRQNRDRSRLEMEYELLDTGAFAGNRYFDVFVEYAKGGADDLLVKITAANRGPDEAPIHLLPTLWFRNTWTWSAGTPRPLIRLAGGTPGVLAAIASHHELGEYTLEAEGAAELLFTENESNGERLWGTPNATPFVKDAFHEAVVNARSGVVNPAGEGTKVAARWVLRVPPGEERSVRLRLRAGKLEGLPEGPFTGFDGILASRKSEADLFYESVTPPALTDDERNVLRQALAGMLWTKQYYYFDLDRWLKEHEAHPMSRMRHGNVRNRNWFHMVNDDIISMPDKWEYPWYAAWDLAFHTVALNIVDHDFAREQLDLMLSEVYLHPNGQIPAYEWNFGDVNPPVHAWATIFSWTQEEQADGAGDLPFLKEAFQKLLLNFTWWVNRKDASGKNVFEGGFLGLDNIGVFDRSSPLPTGGCLEQADGTAWMAFFSQNMLEISLELAEADPVYEEMVLKFLTHFLWIAGAMDPAGDNADELWDEEDGFFYDVLRLPDGSAQRLKVRSMVGLLPLCAVSVFPDGVLEKLPRVAGRVRAFIEKNAGLLVNIHDPLAPGHEGRHLLSVLNESKLRRVLARMLDESRFLSPHGIRSLSKWHEENPFVFSVHGQEYRVKYEPAESTTGMFGGNSNWRGPVWMPVNLLIVRALLQYYTYYGDSLKVECPTGSGNEMNLFEVAREISRRLAATFLKGPDGKRPLYGGTEVFQSDPHWKDLLLFYEYFHGDNGAGLGASHQTGWTGVVARLIQMFGHLTAEEVLKGGGRPVTRPYRRPR